MASSLSRPGEAPLVLGRVCRAWRLIAFSTPELWSRFEFTVEDLSPSKKVLVEDWFARSGARLLSLGIHISRPTNSINDWHHIFELSHTRWKNVTFYLEQADKMQFFAFKFPFHQLQTLEMVVLDSRFSPRYAVYLDFFDDAPMLREVRIMDDGWGAYALKLHWHQVTSLRMINCGSGRILEVLRQCPNLLDFGCVLGEDMFMFPVPPHPRPVQLTQLHILAISVQDDFLVADHLVLPVLDALAVDSDVFEHEFEPEWYESLISLLSRSRCPLRILTIKCADWALPELAPCILLAPGLVKLDINGPLGRDTVRQLTFQPMGNNQASSFLLPKLEKLSFDCGRKAGHRACLDMICSRWNHELWRQGNNGISRLRCVHLRFTQELPEPAIISQVDELRAEGLDITLHE
jgi:hypothetical protein